MSETNARGIAIGISGTLHSYGVREASLRFLQTFNSYGVQKPVTFVVR